MSYTKFTLTLTGDTNDFTTLHLSIQLSQNTNYEAALLSIDLYNSFPNITEENNKFKYFNGTLWKTITIDTGS